MSAPKLVKIYVTLKSGVLDPQGQAVQRSLARLGFSEARDVRVGVGGCQSEGRRGNAQACRQSNDIPACGRESGFVEIVDVEIRQAIVAQISAEILQMKVTANPCGRCIVTRRDPGEPLIKQMARPAQEREGVVIHGGEFDRKTLGLASPVVVGDQIGGWRHVHTLMCFDERRASACRNCAREFTIAQRAARSGSHFAFAKVMLCTNPRERSARANIQLHLFLRITGKIEAVGPHVQSCADEVEYYAQRQHKRVKMSEDVLGKLNELCLAVRSRIEATPDFKTLQALERTLADVRGFMPVAASEAEAPAAAEAAAEAAVAESAPAAEAEAAAPAEAAPAESSEAAETEAAEASAEPAAAEAEAAARLADQNQVRAAQLEADAFASRQALDTANEV